MDRLASRRTRTPESEEEDDSRPQTPLSTAPNDRKRARRQAESSDDEEPEDTDASEQQPDHTQMSTSEVKPNITNLQDRTGHQPGAIVRVKLRNFVTYTSAEFRPGPSLNMVIGPNGTGKSTLVCALCLGLGWPTHHLGRAKDAAEFVKHGSREATIEIELQRKESGPSSTKKNPVITRTIKRDGNKSTFTLNGSSTTMKAVQVMCKKTFNIQIDNLCQFLPQDRVVEFAQMSPVQVLESTQQAAGTEQMATYHSNLIKLRSAQKVLMQDNRGQRETLQNLERRQDAQRSEVERMKERAQTKKKLEWLEQCQPIPTYGKAKQDQRDAKSLQRELNVELNKLKADLGPAFRKVNDKQDYMNQRDTVKKDMQRAVQTAEKKFEAKEKVVKDLTTRCEEYMNNIASERTSIKKKQEEKLKKTHTINGLKHQLEQNKPPEFDSRGMSQEIKDRRDEIRHLQGEVDDAVARRNDLRDQGNRRSSDLKKVRDETANLETQAGQQTSKLKDFSKDTHEAWMWIQENQDLFEKPVYGPPLIECSLKDQRLADSIESMMRPSDFKIITVQTDKDFALLQQKLNREQQLFDFSIRTCSETDLSRFRRPISPDSLEAYGLDGYLIEQLQGPAPVLAMLCNERFLHQYAFASRTLSNEEHNRLANSELKSYVSGPTVYSFQRRAEYSKDAVTRTNPVGKAKHWIDQPVDMGRKAAMDRDIAQMTGELSIIKEEHSKCKVEIVEFEQKMKGLEGEIKTIQDEKDEAQRQLVQWNSLPVKLADLEKAIKVIDDWLAGCRDRQEEAMKKKDTIMLETAGAAVQLTEAISDIKDAKVNLIKAQIHFIEATSDFETLRERNRAMKALLDQKVNEEKTARDVAEAATRQARQLIGVVQGIHKTAQKLAEEGDGGFLELIQTMCSKDSEEGPWNEVRLDAEIDSHKAQLALTEGGSMRAVKEYEDRAKAIERFQRNVAEFEEKQQEHKDAIKEVREKWEGDLETLVAKISEAFSASFARIGLAGQVAVHKASSEDPADCTEENGGTENGLDFANWAIHISVKFRENEPLSLLDSHRQSGGERAVSTIFYLMALQSLSRAPFRVVDEINQGMDPRNERMVHGRMVDIATDGGGSQYFLITPKLLTGLKYKRGMKVLCIVSGEQVPADGATYQNHDKNDVPAPKFDPRAFARKARELNKAADFADVDGGRRTDSGVGLGGSRASVGVSA